MVKSNITYRQLKRILLDNGFLELRTKGKHLLFIHQEYGTKVILPHPSTKQVPIVYVKAIGKMLDEYEIMPAEEFYQLVFEKGS